MNWPGAARDHGTFCVSCHTAVPYALARPALREVLGERQPSADETRLLENVKKRVRLWNEVDPFYGDKYGGQKAAESRGTEAVLNALILASNDAETGHLSEDTRVALGNMWALQKTAGDQSGSWSWLQFSEEPWEANDSQYYGAALAAIATWTAPDDYQSIPQIQNNLTLLRKYLVREYPKQSLINQVVLLWASSKVPMLLSPEQRDSIIGAVFSKQREDGGWRLPALAWKWDGWKLSSIARIWLRPDRTAVETRSDGYATGLIAFVLQQTRVPVDDVHLRRAISWLRSNQNRNSGSWPSYSLNKRRDPGTNAGLFMSDAATAYAVLALAEREQYQSSKLDNQIRVSEQVPFQRKRLVGSH